MARLLLAPNGKEADGMVGDRRCCGVLPVSDALLEESVGELRCAATLKPGEGAVIDVDDGGA